MLSLGCLKCKYLIIRDISDKIRQDLHQFRQNPTKSDIHIDKFYMSIISFYGFISTLPDHFSPAPRYLYSPPL